MQKQFDGKVCNRWNWSASGFRVKKTRWNISRFF